MLASLSAFKPAAQGCLGLTRTSPCKETFDTDVFVQVGPVQALALPDKPPVCSFGKGTVRESWVPSEWNADNPTIDKIDHQGIFRE